VCNETFLYITVRAMILSAKTLPKPYQYNWPARTENMKKQLDELINLVRDKQFDPLDLDKRVSDWDCATSDRLVEGPIPAYSSSLDATLSFIKQRLPHASMTIYIYTNGTAIVKLSVQDGHGDFHVYTTPARISCCHPVQTYSLCSRPNAEWKVYSWKAHYPRNQVHPQKIANRE
jgi:hypothetical protein